MPLPFNIEGLRVQAQKRLPRMVFDYLDGGAESEWGLAHNRHALQDYRLQPQRLKDVSIRSHAIDTLGKNQSLPLIIAPTGLNGIFWNDGDMVLARAAQKHHIPFCLSTASNCSLERLRKNIPEANERLWFQLYIFNREAAKNLIERAKRLQYEALIITVDVPTNGKRERDIRSGFKLPFEYTARAVWDVVSHPRWAWEYLTHPKPSMENLATTDDHNLELQAALLSRKMDASFDWESLQWLRDQWHGKLIVKGILSPADAQRCEAIGCDAIIVSNHGGRQIDSCVAPVDVLPAIRRAVHMEIFVDSGIRRGADVVKLLALGANAVLVGRATLYGLAAYGAQGVDHAIDILKTEMDITLANIGCADVRQLDASYLHHKD